MTKPAPSNRLSIRPYLAPDLLHWVEERCILGVFNSPSAAMEAGLVWMDDTYRFIEAACRRKKAPFDPAAFWRVFDAEIQSSVPNRVGEWGHQGALPGNVGRKRQFGFIRQDLLGRFAGFAQPAGPFSQASPIPHAVEAGLRVLRAVEIDSPSRLSRFPFDADRYWTLYAEALASVRQA